MCPKKFITNVGRDEGCTREGRKLALVVDVKDFRMDKIKQYHLIRSVLSKPVVLENSL